ncbi:hypothetical protein [Peribacillus kribbensis]|uniref:hypothetical protein n=1 Tax=Peribacillus kribbensis TaxID=356658 RepID=UPI0004061593|nr:hypothetical protein [Peribacillus kribbensis]
MSTNSSSGIKRGQALSFRIPSDAPDHVIKQLQRLKESEKRNFSSKIAEYVMDGVSQTMQRDREAISIPIPKQLSKAQRDWLKHEHSEAMLGSILYQLISDPIRSSALLAALNSSSLDIDEALYLQEETPPLRQNPPSLPQAEETAAPESEEEPFTPSFDDADLDDFDWSAAKKEIPEEESSEEETLEDLLGDFLSQMNK